MWPRTWAAASRMAASAAATSVHASGNCSMKTRQRSLSCSRGTPRSRAHRTLLFFFFYNFKANEVNVNTSFYTDQSSVLGCHQHVYNFAS